MDLASQQNIWTNLISQGPLILLLAIAVYVLWKRDSERDNKIDTYITEDRNKMYDAINRNTTAFTDHTETIKELKDAIDKFGEKERRY